ncbi:hypothetical protein QZH41_004665 [Actinostola sp. cb2023]|nr:hypothetical protein QZH41_004665 [Actinostola sp. cb2023]
MERANKLLYLFEEIKAKVQYLENALDEISQVKKSLKVNSADAKSQIRDSISRHLEALRNREIWLVSQVELIQHGKDDVLSQKQAELLELVGGTMKVCDLLEQSADAEQLGEFEVFEDQLSDLLKSVENMSISPEENPSILFSSQNLELLESIRSFGSVDADGKEESRITSLLKNMDLSGSPGNKRKFMTSSGQIENWLLHEPKYLKFQPAPSSPPLSVKKWLTKCKPYTACDVESEMGYSEKSDAIDNKWLLSLEKSPNQPDQGVFLGYFNEVKMSSPSRWIKESTKAPELLKTTLIGETYSKIASLGNDNWLLYKQEKSKLRNLPIDLGKIHSVEDCNSKWLRKSVSAGILPETSTGKAYAALAATSLKQWLKPIKPWSAPCQTKCNDKGDCSDCDRWLSTSSSSNTSIKIDDLDFPDSSSDADWLKVKDVDAISIENLDAMFSVCCNANESYPCSPLVDQEDKSGIKKYNAMLQAQPNEDWLQRSVKSETEMEVSQHSNVMKVFSDSLGSNDYNKWLARPSGMSSDVCKWLARSSQERCKNCPKTCSKGLFTLFDEVKGTSNNIWLKNIADA